MGSTKSCLDFNGNGTIVDNSLMRSTTSGALQMATSLKHVKQQATSRKLQAPSPSSKPQASSFKHRPDNLRLKKNEKNIWHPTFSMIEDNYVYTSFYAQRALQNLQDREGISWVRTGPQFTRRAKTPLAWFCVWLQSCGPQNQQDFGWEKILIFKTQARKRLASLEWF